MATHTIVPIRAFAIAALAVATIAGCRDEVETATPTPDSTGAVAPAPTEAPGPGASSEPAGSFAEAVYDEYKGLALGVPRREQDSIVQATPITEIERVMTERMRRQDSIARAQLAEKHGITRDSVDAILLARNVPKR